MMEYIYELIQKIKSQQFTILNLEKKLADLKKEKEELQKVKRNIELDIQKDVAFDKELKNDKQRQVKAKELLDSNEIYLGSLEAEHILERKISDTIYQIKKEQIELDYLKRLYEIQLTKEKRTEIIEENHF